MLIMCFNYAVIVIYVCIYVSRTINKQLPQSQGETHKIM